MMQKIHEVWAFLESGTGTAEWGNFIAILVVGATLCYAIHLVCRPILLRIFHPITWLPTRHSVHLIIRLAQGLLALQFLTRALDVFKGMPGWLWQWKTDLIPWGYGIVFFMFAIRSVDLLVAALCRRWSHETTDMDESIAIFIGRVAKTIIICLLAMVVLDNLGVKVWGLITGLGFAGAAFALAAQASLANSIGYFEILFDRLFKVGDFIAFGDYQGFVSNIGLRSVEIQSLHGERINVPNKDLVDKQIRNFTRGKNHRLKIAVGITYDNGRNSVEKALQILKEIFEKKDFVHQCDAGFRKFGDSTLDLEVVFWIPFTTNSEYNQILNDANLEIKEAFDAAGIEFAFPTRMLYVKQLGVSLNEQHV